MEKRNARKASVDQQHKTKEKDVHKEKTKEEKDTKKEQKKEKVVGNLCGWLSYFARKVQPVRLSLKIELSEC